MRFVLHPNKVYYWLGKCRKVQSLVVMLRSDCIRKDYIKTKKRKMKFEKNSVYRTFCLKPSSAWKIFIQLFVRISYLNCKFVSCMRGVAIFSSEHDIFGPQTHKKLYQNLT